MKKLLLISITFLFAFTANVFAQNSENAAVTVEATIASNLTISAENALGFGTVTAGQSTTLDNNISSDAGKVLITGPNEETLNVSAPTSVTLSGDGDDIVANLEYVGNQTDDQDTALEGNLDAEGGTITTHATSGEFYIWIGGGFTTDNNQTPGTYSGTVTVEVSYPI